MIVCKTLLCSHSVGVGDASQFCMQYLIMFRKVWLAPGPGFEPGLEDSKSSVLPLDDPGRINTGYCIFCVLSLIILESFDYLTRSLLTLRLLNKTLFIPNNRNVL